MRTLTVRTRKREWIDTEICHRELLRNLPVAVYTCDAGGRVTFFNQAAAELWGRPPTLFKDLWCQPWKLYRGDGVPMAPNESPINRTLVEGRAIRGEIIVVERADGTRHRVMGYSEPVVNDRGRVVGAVSTMVDMAMKSQNPQADPQTAI